MQSRRTAPVHSGGIDGERGNKRPVNGNWRREENQRSISRARTLYSVFLLSTASNSVSCGWRASSSSPFLRRLLLLLLLPLLVVALRLWGIWGSTTDLAVAELLVVRLVGRTQIYLSLSTVCVCVYMCARCGYIELEFNGRTDTGERIKLFLASRPSNLPISLCKKSVFTMKASLARAITHWDAKGRHFHRRGPPIFSDELRKLRQDRKRGKRCDFASHVHQP